MLCLTKCLLYGSTVCVIVECLVILVLTLIMQITLNSDTAMLERLIRDGEVVDLDGVRLVCKHTSCGLMKRRFHEGLCMVFNFKVPLHEVQLRNKVYEIEFSSHRTQVCWIGQTRPEIPVVIALFGLVSAIGLLCSIAKCDPYNEHIQVEPINIELQPLGDLSVVAT